MRSVQISLDEELIDEVDQFINLLNTTRSDFIGAAIRKAIQRENLLLEEKHRKGYKLLPVKEAELLDWKDEQAWGD